MKNRLKFIAITLIFFFNSTTITLATEKIIYVHPGSFGNVFDTNTLIGNGQISCVRLKQALENIGYNFIQTNSIENLYNFEFLFVFDASHIHLEHLNAYPKNKRVLFLWEPPTVSPYSYNTVVHDYFCVIFTWNDSLVDNKRYFHFNNPQPVLSTIEPFINFDKKHLSTLIAGDKASFHPQELYSERRKTIEFFENIPTNDFDLYGVGWQKRGYKNYKGVIQNKNDYLKKYKFCFCYENMRDIHGYVTEKIFDCFVAGCVPIYWGATNIDTYIPANCFIDRRTFNDTQGVYEYIKNMTQQEHELYLSNIRNYFASPQAHQFSSDFFIKTIINTLHLDEQQ